MSMLSYMFVALAGGLSAIQSGSNAQLVRSIGRPWLAAFLISLITTAVFAVGLIASGGEAPDDSRFGSAPWWAWVGGLCGAAYVTSTFFAKSMGAGIFTGLTITAGIVVSIGLDHFGLIGFQQHSAGFLRIAGAALMIVGLTLVARF